MARSRQGWGQIIYLPGYGKGRDGKRQNKSLTYLVAGGEQVHRSYSDGDADLVPSAKSSDPMTINMK